VAASWTWDVAAGSPLHVEADVAADEVKFRLNVFRLNVFRLNGVAVAAVPVGTVIRATGEAGQITATARVTVMARADGILTPFPRSTSHKSGPPMFSRP
jgi:hypothetical protein